MLVSKLSHSCRCRLRPRLPAQTLMQYIQERLTPSAAVSKLNERVKRIGKVNAEIADWLQVSLMRDSIEGGTLFTR